MEIQKVNDGGYIGKSIVPSHCVQAADDSARVAIPTNPGAPKLQVELIRDGDVIRAIDIVCVCGERIRLLCNYNA